MPIDLDLFMRHMRGRGLAEVLLRGHLWVENFIVELLEAELKDASVLRLDRTPFVHKLNLAQAIGMIDPGEATPIRTLNTLRNRLAHDLAGDPTHQEIQTLRSQLIPLGRNLLDTMLEKNKFPGSGSDAHLLECCVHAILITLESHRQQHVWSKSNAQALDTYRLIAALNERRNIPSDHEALLAKYGVQPHPEPEDIWVKTAEWYDENGDPIASD